MNRRTLTCFGEAVQDLKTATETARQKFQRPVHFEPKRVVPRKIPGIWSAGSELFLFAQRRVQEDPIDPNWSHAYG